MSLLGTLFGDSNTRVVQAMQPLVDAINALESSFAAQSDDELRGTTRRLRERLSSGATLDDLLVEAFAAVREAAKRTLGQRHYDVQLIGGIVLHRGQIAEMKTGEGKTLVATLPLYLNALQGKGTHIVTVNDYLAKRDAQWMGRVYNTLGMSVSCIGHEIAYRVENNEMLRVARGDAYKADITYGTNNEFGFDYLRDNMAVDGQQLVGRPFFYAIVDEVDSILIDEARTPLIISAPAEESTEQYYRFAQLAKRLDPTSDYTLDEKLRSVILTEKGIGTMEQWLGVGNLYAVEELATLHHVEQALKAHALYQRDRDYVVKDGEVIIVDEFTGRMMFGRRYSEGLHQAIEAKEGVEIQRESRTLATITIQNYFRLYPKLAGMTGTAATEAEEFSKIYRLEVVVIPTHRAMVRGDLSDRVYRNEHGKYQAVVSEIKERHKRGQPVLVGTISIEKNEKLAAMLDEAGVPFQMLNAKNHEREAAIIAEAGRTGAVTIATNMAGRGVDIILGGAPPALEKEKEVKKERKEREGVREQGAEGREQSEEELVVGAAIVSFRSMEEWLGEHERVVALGGLHVIGTERHESRRIDNQLRGRAGRQGDPGSSQFYVSMEDDMMRIFGSDRVKGLMERLGLPEDVPIENRIVTKSLEAAQKKVEGHNFDTRKHLVEYDDVMNKQREVIYKRRREVLTDPSDNRQRIRAMVEEEIDAILAAGIPDEGEPNTLQLMEQLSALLPVPSELAESIQSVARSTATSAWQKRTAVGEIILPLSLELYGKLQQSIDEEAQRRGLPSNTMEQIERQVLLRALDMLWMDHLDAIDHLRTGIGLRGYGQRDPLVEYKREAYRMFSELLNHVSRQVVNTIYKVGIMSGFAPSVFTPAQNIQYSAPVKEAQQGAESREAAYLPAGRGAGSIAGKVGRNEPCPCGSGKKYKKCHGG